MKPNRSNPLLPRLAGVTLASFLVVAGNAAEIAYKTTAASTAEATTAANWMGGVAPGTGDIAAWLTDGDTVTAGNQESRGGTVTISSPVSWLGLRHEDSSGSLSLTGSPVTLGSSGITEVRWELLNIANDVVLGADQTWNIGGQTTTVTGALSGGFALTKSGAAGLVLSGNNSGYTGALTLGQGTLTAANLGGALTLNAGTANLSGAVSGTTTTSAGTTLNLNSGASLAAITVNGGTINQNSGSTITGDLTTLGTTTVNLGGTLGGSLTLDVGDTLGLRGGSIGGGLTLLGDTTMNFTAPVSVAGNVAVSGIHSLNFITPLAFGTPTTILSHTGTLTDTDDSDPTNNFVIPSLFRSSSITDTGTALQVTINPGLALIWTGADGTNPSFWDVNTTLNWSGGDTKFINSDSVTFDDTATGTAVELKSNVLPNGITFNNSSKDFTLTGNTGFITGATGVTKNGTGTVTLGGSNGQNFTGAIAVNGGTLKMGSRDAFGVTSGITIASGAVVDVNGQSPGSIPTGGYTYQIAGDGTGGGAIVNTGADVASNAGVKTLNLTGNASIGVVSGSRMDVGFANTAGTGAINGNGFTLTKKGAGGVGFRGPANGSAISIVIEAGTAWAENNANAFGGTTGSVLVKNGARCGTYGTLNIPTPVTVENGGTLHVQANVGTGTWSGNVTLNNGATVESGGAQYFSGAATHNANGSINKTGGGQLTITGSLAGTGGTLNHNAGTIQIGDVGTTGSISGFSTINVGSGLIFRSRLSGASNSISSNFTFASATSELRQHAGLVGDTLTLSGSIGTNSANGILRSTFGKLVLASGATSTVNMVAAQGAPASGRGTIEVQSGATLTSPWFNIGQDSGQSGVLSVTGGTVNVTTGSNGVRIGHWNNNSSTVPSELLVSKGTFDASTTNITTSIGWDGYGKMTVGGGADPALGKFWRLTLDANGDSTTYSDTATVSTNGTVEIGGGGITSASSSDYVILNGGTLTGTATSTWGARMDSVAASVLTTNTGVTATLSGQLTGTANLAKTGAGTLVVSNAANTYSGVLDTQAGATDVSANQTTGDFTASGTGTVRLAGTTTRNLVAKTGGTLQPGTLSAVGSAVATSLDFQGGAASFRVGTTGDLLTVPTVTVTSPSSITVVPNNALTAPSSFTLIDYTGSIGGSGIGGLSLNLSNPHYSASLADDAINTQILVNVTAADSVVWKGNVNGTWDVNATSNWVLASNGLTSSKFYDFDVVKFDDAGITTPTVTLSGTIKPATLSVENTTGTYTFQGSGLSGGTGLAKSGAGALTLLANNTNTGVVSITGGTVNVGDGGTAGVLGGTGGITLTGATLAFNRSDAVTHSRTVTGSGTLRKQGAGTFNFTATGASVLPTNLVVDAGTFQISSGSFANDRMTGSGVVTINSGAILLLASGAAHALGGSNLGLAENLLINGGTLTVNQEQYISTMTLSGGTVNGTSEIRVPNSATYTVSGTAPSTVACTVSQGFSNATWNVADVTSSAAADVTVSGVMSNTFGFIKSGAGTMALTGVNTYTGATTINAGTLQIGAGGTTGNLGTGAVTNNATLLFNRSNALAVTNVISGTGSVVQSGGGTTTLSGVNTYTGNTVVNSGTLSLADNAQLKFVIGANGVNNKVSGTGAVEFLGDFNLDLSGADTTTGNSWTLVDASTLSEVFVSTFTIPGFTENTPGVHTFENGNTTWTFTEATGVLSVVSGTPYDSWETANGIAGAGAAADSDNDGISNGIEFVIGGDPSGPGSDSSTLLPTITVDGTYLNFTFRRTTASASFDPFVEYGSNLTGWTAADAGVNGVIVNESADFFGSGIDKVEVRIPQSLAVGAKLFARLRVDIVP